jgi:hypothetical protein
MFPRFLEAGSLEDCLRTYNQFAEEVGGLGGTFVLSGSEL